MSATETPKPSFTWTKEAQREKTRLLEQWWEPSAEEWESYTEAEKKAILGEIAGKMMTGRMLTPKEFAIAQLDGMWPKESFYQDYVVVMYEDDEVRGQIDGKSTPEVLAAEKAQEDKEMKETGSTHLHFHQGIPIGEVRFDKLSLYQKVVLGKYDLLKYTIGYKEESEE